MRVNDLQKLLTKPIVPYTEAISDSLGMDPIELPEYWIANDFITFRFFYAGGAKEHMVNLTKHEELTADGKTLLESDIMHTEIRKTKVFTVMSVSR